MSATCTPIINVFIQHRLAQNVEETMTIAPLPVEEQVFCPFWSCLPNLDAIVALRASVVAFDAPLAPTASTDDQCADLFSLCAARCCDAAIAFAAAKAPPTPTDVATNVRSASLISPDSSGADGFEGSLASHTACDLLNMSSWLTRQCATGAVAGTADAECLCPADLINCMAMTAASLSDSQMYGHHVFLLPML